MLEHNLHEKSQVPNVKNKQKIRPLQLLTLKHKINCLVGLESKTLQKSIKCNIKNAVIN